MKILKKDILNTLIGFKILNKIKAQKTIKNSLQYNKKLFGCNDI